MMKLNNDISGEYIQEVIYEVSSSQFDYKAFKIVDIPRWACAYMAKNRLRKNEDLKTEEIDLRKIGVSRKIPLGNTVEKEHMKFHSNRTIKNL